MSGFDGCIPAGTDWIRNCSIRFCFSEAIGLVVRRSAGGRTDPVSNPILTIFHCQYLRKKRITNLPWCRKQKDVTDVHILKILKGNRHIDYNNNTVDIRIVYTLHQAVSLLWPEPCNLF